MVNTATSPNIVHVNLAFIFERCAQGHPLERHRAEHFISILCRSPDEPGHIDAAKEIIQAMQPEHRYQGAVRMAQTLPKNHPEKIWASEKAIDSISEIQGTFERTDAIQGSLSEAYGDIPLSKRIIRTRISLISDIPEADRTELMLKTIDFFIKRSWERCGQEEDEETVRLIESCLEIAMDNLSSVKDKGTHPRIAGEILKLAIQYAEVEKRILEQTVQACEAPEQQDYRITNLFYHIYLILPEEHFYKDECINKILHLLVDLPATERFNQACSIATHEQSNLQRICVEIAKAAFDEIEEPEDRCYHARSSFWDKYPEPTEAKRSGERFFAELKKYIKADPQGAAFHINYRLGASNEFYDKALEIYQQNTLPPQQTPAQFASEMAALRMS